MNKIVCIVFQSVDKLVLTSFGCPLLINLVDLLKILFKLRLCSHHRITKQNPAKDNFVDKFLSHLQCHLPHRGHTKNGYLIDRCERFVIEQWSGRQILKVDDVIVMCGGEVIEPTNYGTSCL